MKNLQLFLSLLLCSVLAIIGCSKSAGPAGPAGPVGPAGPDSVSYSAWVQLSMTKTVGGPNDTFYLQTIVAPSITQNVLDRSVILSYISFKDQAGGTNIFSSSEIPIQITYSIGKIDLFSRSDLSYAITSWSYRYVIVPGKISVNGIISWPSKGYTPGELKSMTYQEIVKLLGLSTAPGSN